jgi:hypothetical protein
MEAAPTCFGLQRNHPQGATASTCLKLQALFSVGIDVQTLSLLWRHSMTCVAFGLCTVLAYTVYANTVQNTHATQVILCRHSTDNVCTTSVSTLNQACNLSKYWVWLPEDGFFVNRNMLEQHP